MEINTLFIEKLLKKPFHKHSLWGDKKFYDPQLHPITHELESNFPAIQAEVKELLKRYDEFANFQSISPDQTYISNDDRWRMFFFKAAGVSFGKNKQLCPVAMSIVDKHKDVISAYISVLGARKLLNPHEGPWSGILRMHLGVVVPEYQMCSLHNGGEVYFWEEGKCVLFDDTYTHMAFNDTDSIRAVLFLDIMRPLPQPWKAINWAILRLSILFPYIWIPYFRHKKWEKQFYKQQVS